MSLTQDIREYALDLGYSAVGVTTADSFSEYLAMLESRSEMYAFYVKDPRQPLEGAVPKRIMPSAKSIVSVAYDYAKEAFPDELLRMIGRIYLARAYGPPANRINGARRELLRQFLKKNGCEVGHGIFLPERFAAARAGVTTYGKNNFAYVRGIGSFVALNSFVLDVELEYDESTLEVKCPAKCTACIEACPTGAICEPLKLNPSRCISYNNWWTNGRPGVSSYIPPDIREKIGTRIHGCDVCQEVCPRNHKRLREKLPPNEFLLRVAQDFGLAKMLTMTDEFYATRVEPLMYNYIRDKEYFQRNAAIALGNLGDPEYVHDLARAMHYPAEVVRAYSAWALGRIGGALAKQILEASLTRESSDSVKAEIRASLAGMQGSR